MAEVSPPSKSFHYLVSMASAVGGAMVMWWSLSDRMEKQITEKVNLVSRVAQLAERIEGQKAEIQNLRNDINALRQPAVFPQPTK